MFIDRLRITVQRLLDNVAELQKLPGARLLRVGGESVARRDPGRFGGRPAVQDREPCSGSFFATALQEPALVESFTRISYSS